MITKSLFILTLALAVISTYLAVHFQKLYKAQVNAVVEAAVNPSTGDILVRVGKQRIYGFAGLCPVEREYF